MSTTLPWNKWQSILRTNPRRLAVIDATTGKTWSRSALNQKILRLAAAELDDAKRRRVALCWPNSINWLAAFLAVQKQSGSIISLDAGTPSGAQETTARQLGADWLYSAQLGLVRLRSRRSTASEVFIKITSGSTGLPKHVPCKARHLLADGRQIVLSMKLTENDRNLALIPFGHSYGLGNLVMPLIIQGTSVVYASAFVPGQIPEWIQRYRVTVFPSVPAVFQILAQLPGQTPLTPLRLAVSAGSRLSPETARAFLQRFGVRIHNFYGSSETGGICFDRTGESSLHGKSLGSALSGVRISVLANGRICVSSSAVATSSASVTLPDLGAWTETGELRLIGRMGQVANLGGKKVLPSEIETVLRDIPGVREAWVTVLTQAGRHYLAAAVESSISTETIRKHLARVLPEWKLPRIVKTMLALPHTERGKLDANRLRKWLET